MARLLASLNLIANRRATPRVETRDEGSDGSACLLRIIRPYP